MSESMYDQFVCQIIKKYDGDLNKALQSAFSDRQLYCDQLGFYSYAIKKIKSLIAERDQP